MTDGVVEWGTHDGDVDVAGPKLRGLGYPGQLREGAGTHINGKVEIGVDLVFAVPAIGMPKAGLEIGAVWTIGHRGPPGRRGRSSSSAWGRGEVPSQGAAGSNLTVQRGAQGDGSTRHRGQPDQVPAS